MRHFRNFINGERNKDKKFPPLALDSRWGRKYINGALYEILLKKCMSKYARLHYKNI